VKAARKLLGLLRGWRIEVLGREENREEAGVGAPRRRVIENKH